MRFTKAKNKLAFLIALIMTISILTPINVLAEEPELDVYVAYEHDEVTQFYDMIAFNGDLGISTFEFTFFEMDNWNAPRLASENAVPLRDVTVGEYFGIRYHLSHTGSAATTNTIIRVYVDGPAGAVVTYYLGVGSLGDSGSWVIDKAAGSFDSWIGNGLNPSNTSLPSRFSADTPGTYTITYVLTVYNPIVVITDQQEIARDSFQIEVVPTTVEIEITTPVDGARIFRGTTPFEAVVTVGGVPLSVNEEVVWTNTSPNINTQFNANGVLTIPNGKPLGQSFTITAAYAQNPDISYTITVTVVAESETIITPLSDYILRGGSMAINSTVRMAADMLGNFAGNPNQYIEWSIEPPINGVTISEDGVLNVAADAKVVAGDYIYVRAYFPGNHQLNASYAPLVSVAVYTIDIVVTPGDDITILRGINEFSANVTVTGAPHPVNDSVTWDHTSPNINTHIDADGVLTVAANTPLGQTFSVIAISAYNPNVKSIVTVRIVAESETIIMLPSEYISAGESMTIESRVRQAPGMLGNFAGNPNQHIEWFIDPAISGVSIEKNSDGTATLSVAPDAAVGNGYITIRAHFPGNHQLNESYALANVAIIGTTIPPDITITITTPTDEARIFRGTTQFEAVVTVDGVPLAVNEDVIWTHTSGPSQFDANGVLTVPANKGLGLAFSVTAAFVQDPTISYTINVRVVADSLITITSSPNYVMPGDSFAIEATVGQAPNMLGNFGQASPHHRIRWFIEHPIAGVSIGETSGVLNIANNANVTAGDLITIRAHFIGNPPLNESYLLFTIPVSTLTVIPDLTLHTITPSPAALNVGDTIGVAATLNPDIALPTDWMIIWTSTNSSVATTSGSGLVIEVEGISQGTTTITASLLDNNGVEVDSVVFTVLVGTQDIPALAIKVVSNTPVGGGQDILTVEVVGAGNLNQAIDNFYIYFIHQGFGWVSANYIQDIYISDTAATVTVMLVNGTPSFLGGSGEIFALTTWTRSS